jgi:hypothetical protein
MLMRVRCTAATPTWSRPLLVTLLLISLAATAQAQNKCSATGVMGGEKFVTSHCAVALENDEHSVTIWFNENPISPKEMEDFQNSAFASPTKDGKERTMLLAAFCPGGGKTVASAGSVKSIDLGMTHAKSAMAGAQWVIKPPKEFKVDAISGDLKPGGKLAGKITGSRSSDGRPYSYDLAFDVTLPAKSAASGVACGK